MQAYVNYLEELLAQQNPTLAVALPSSGGQVELSTGAAEADGQHRDSVGPGSPVPLSHAAYPGPI